MVDLFANALTLHGKPDALYLDNGATYRGSVLATACGRLGVGLLHAKPYDPEARGKMERFWRTLREQALDHIGQVRSLDEVEQKLRNWLIRFYQVSPHAGILGRAPAAVYAEDDQKTLVDAAALRDALLVRAQRRVRKVSTLGIDGKQYEIAHGYLAGQVVTVRTCLLDSQPVLEHQGRSYPLRPVDPVHNGHTRRQALPPEFHVLDVKPGEWTALDSMGWAIMMALDLGGNWGNEFARFTALEAIDTKALWELFPPYPGEQPAATADLARLYRFHGQSN